MSYGYIYETSCMVKDMRYIGQNKGQYDPEYLGSGIYLNRDIKKIGADKFNKPVILTWAESKEELDEMEKYLIADYRLLFGREHLYNISDGGDGFTGTHTNVAKEKCRQSQLGTKWIHNNELQQEKKVKDNLVQDYLSNGLVLGMNNETKEKMRKAQTGRKESEETKEKISKIQLGHTVSEATKEKMRKPKSNTQNMMKPKSEKQRKNMALAQQKRRILERELEAPK